MSGSVFRSAARLVLAVAIGASLGACEPRPRSNPLDPENSETGGALTGFVTLASDASVEIRWQRLTQTGVLGYRVLRARVGENPHYLRPAPYASTTTGDQDTSVVNGTTYVYQLVAYFESGDSAVSPADSATPDARRVIVLDAAEPSLIRLTPDLRDVLFAQPAVEAYEDMELDARRSILWLTAPLTGRVFRRFLDGTAAGVTLAIESPSDVSISELRGFGWVALPQPNVVRAYGPNLDDETPSRAIAAVGEARVVEASRGGPTLWIGNDAGTVYRFNTDQEPLGQWSVGSDVVAIALDEDRSRAWVVVRLLAGDDLYRIDGVDSTVTLMRSGLANVADISYDAGTQSLWVSERGPPLEGLGRLLRLNDAAATLAEVTGIEPFGIATDERDGTCWTTDLRSKRLLQIAPDGSTLRASRRLDTPYAVRIDFGP